MKRVINLIFILLLSYNLCSQTVNYIKGNGTILDSRNDASISLIIRQHNQLIKIGNSPEKEELIVFNIPDKELGIQIFLLHTGDIIKIDRIEEKIIRPGSNQEIWIHFNIENEKNGWIIYRGQNPYENEAWSVSEIVIKKQGQWTVRKLEQNLEITTNVNVRDRPGITESDVLFVLKATSVNNEWNVSTIGITEEIELVDGVSDHWVKIKDYKGRVGWIFGGYTEVERGGPKYFTPENRIANQYDDAA